MRTDGENAVFQAMLTGLKPGMIIGLSVNDEHRKHHCDVARLTGIDVMLHGQFLYRPDMLQGRIDREPMLADALGWNRNASVTENIALLYNVPVRKEGVFGLVAGYPTSAILGYMTENSLGLEGFHSLGGIVGHLRGGLKRIEAPLPNKRYERALRTLENGAFDRKTLLERMVEETLRKDGHHRQLIKAFYEALGASTETALFLSSRTGLHLRDDKGNAIFSFITYKGLGFEGMNAPDVTALREKVRIAYGLI